MHCHWGLCPSLFLQIVMAVLRLCTLNKGNLPNLAFPESESIALWKNLSSEVIGSLPQHHKSHPDNVKEELSSAGKQVTIWPAFVRKISSKA